MNGQRKSRTHGSTQAERELMQRIPFLYFWLPYCQTIGKGRHVKLNHVRDGFAFFLLSQALDRRLGSFVDMVKNGPAPPDLEAANLRVLAQLGAENPLLEEVLSYAPMNESFLKRGVMLVAPTRIPLDDFKRGNRVRVDPSFTSIEQKVKRILRRYVTFLSRDQVCLARAVAEQLATAFADRAEIGFKSYKTAASLYTTATYKNLRTIDSHGPRRRAPKLPPRSAGYLLQLTQVPELNGADLLLMWGMGGTQTLAFANLLRNGLSHLLDVEGFSMVEMTEPVDPPASNGGSLALDFVRDWEAEVLLEGVLLDRRTGKVVPSRPVRRRRTPLKAGSSASRRKAKRKGKTARARRSTRGRGMRKVRKARGARRRRTPTAVLGA